MMMREFSENTIENMTGMDEGHFDDRMMCEAIQLAERARGFTSPNPMVGAVVVRDGEIVGRGWHHAAGRPHAEVEAIDDAGDLAAGADIYVTLEPCNHFGKTPPCTRKIIDAGIKRVVVATEDPNPFVRGGGIAFLKESGIDVSVGVCREAAETLIEDFIWYVRHGKRPFVIVKYAATLDGWLATSTGNSQWITSPASREAVHKLRHACDAILVGAGTLRSDDPSLTARLDGIKTKDPRKVILDPCLTISLDAKVLTQSSSAETIVATAMDASLEKCRALESLGATIVKLPFASASKRVVPEDGGVSEGVEMEDVEMSGGGHSGNGSRRLDLDALLDTLGKMGVLSLLVEGGGGVIGSFLSAGLANKAMVFLAPKILGGDDGVPVCRGPGPKWMKDALRLKRVDMERFDDDILIRGYFK